MHEFADRGESAFMSNQPVGRQDPRDVDFIGGHYIGHTFDYFRHRPDGGLTHMISREQNGNWVFISLNQVIKFY